MKLKSCTLKYMIAYQFHIRNVLGLARRTLQWAMELARVCHFSLPSLIAVDHQPIAFDIVWLQRLQKSLK